MRFQRLDLNLLVAMDALLTERSVTAAAERLHLTQPAMSHALARLRQHFDDELLVVVGRKSVLTPRAQAMVEPLREALLRIDDLVAGGGNFDPETCSRRFTIRTSDYALAVCVAAAISRMKVMAPFIGFDVTQPSDPDSRLESGEAMLAILPQQFLLPDHPSLDLFEDEYVVVVWSDGPLADQDIDIDRYFELGHIAVRFRGEREPSFAEVVTLAPPRARRVEITVPTFTLVPMPLIGTDLVASMPRRLAELAARLAPLTIKPLPFQAPKFRECIQWSKLRSADPAIAWIVKQLLAQVQATSHQQLISTSVRGVR